MPTKIKRKRSTQEIQRAADILMLSALDAHFQHTPQELRPNAHYNERGIDWSIEIQKATVAFSDQLPNPIASQTLFIQNKGTDNVLSIRKVRPNKGMLTYKIDRAWTLSYLALDHNNVALITVCDLHDSSLYWCPIQLDYKNYKKQIDIVSQDGGTLQSQGSIQLRIDPKRCLWRKGKPTSNGFDLLQKDIEDSRQFLFERDVKARSRYVAGLDAAPVEVDRSKPLLDQLHTYMSKRFGTLTYMPSEFFIQSYPFKINDVFHPRHDQFTLTTDNEDLIKLFKAVQISGPGKLNFVDKAWTVGVRGAETKMRYILKRLTASLVFNIAGHKSREWSSVRYSEKAKCDCVRCRIDRLDFIGAFESLEAGSSKLNSPQLLSYAHYKVGNFIKSATLLEEINRGYKEQRLTSLDMLSSFSLTKLRTHLKTSYWGDQRPTDLIDRLSRIDTSSLRIIGADKNSRFHEWIDKGRFHSEAMHDLYKTVQEIRDNYHSQQEGGWSQNSNIWELIRDYADLDQFVSHDFVYFDRFDEYRQVTDLFTEGLFAAHAIHPEQKSRLNHIDDWMISKLIWFSEPKRILKYFKRYNLTGVEYKSSSKSDSFIQTAVRVLEDVTPVAKTFNRTYAKTNTTFVQKYNTIVSNILVLASILNLPDDQVNTIAEKAHQALLGKSLLNRGITEYLQLLVRRKGELLGKSQLSSMLLSLPRSQKMHEKGLLEALASSLHKHGGLSLSKAQLKQFVSLTESKCRLCKHPHPIDWLLDLHRLSSDDGIRRTIEQVLEQHLDTHFDPDLFYHSVIFDVLPAPPDLFEKFLQAARPHPDQPTWRSIGGEKDTRRLILDMFINLCFKLDIDLTEKRFDVLRGFDPYYDWLLNIKDFDYAKFEVHWVTAYGTRYYFKEFRKHGVILERLSSHLQDRRDPRIERALVQLYSGRP